MSILFDPVTKRIVLDTTDVTATEIYSRWVDWVAIGDNSKWTQAFRTVGNDDLGGGIAIPVYLFLMNGWRVRPMEANHTLTITGNLFVDGGGDPIVPTLGVFNVLVKSVVPVQAQTVTISGTGGSGASAAEIWTYNNRTLTSIDSSGIASAVRTELTTELTHVMQIPTTSGSLTPTQTTMLLEMYNILGLDPTKPLTVTTTSRTAGPEIVQTITTNSTQTTVTRV